jgi:hypothetical protein
MINIQRPWSEPQLYDWFKYEVPEDAENYVMRSFVPYRLPPH